MAKPNKVKGGKKPVGKKPQFKRGARANNNMTLIFVVFVVFLLLGYWYASWSSEKYDSNLTLSACPPSIMYDGVKYDRLKGHDHFVSKFGSFPRCSDFNVNACMYGRDCQSKTLNDGKKVALTWWTKPVCGVSQYKNTYEFCSDPITVHFDPYKKPIFVEKASMIGGTNACYNKYGISKDKTIFNNGSLSLRSDLINFNNECLGEEDVSKVKLI